MFENATEWDKDYERRVLIEKYRGVLAFAVDGSGYIANLLTLPNFGCVMHEPIP
jgi:hypothetical protein